MLEVIDLSFDYPDKPLLSKLQFSLNSGQLMHLRGANGKGKTTLLKLLAGLLEPSKGEIRYDGEKINKNLRSYHRRLCYVGHKSGINSLLTLRENCFFDMHWGRKHHPLRFEELLEGFGLQGLDNLPVCQLSAGQRRRVGLLKIAMTDASLWLLDEPLATLDAEAIRMVMTCLENHLHQGGQAILTSHQRLPFQHAYQVHTL